jgi:UDP-2,3-diacylglucosamine hydrolase
VDTLFISDIHLSEQRPEKIALFQAFLSGPARQAQALYILGDLFEAFWLGNDDHTPPAGQVMAALLEFTRSGGRLYIIRGNRELMLDAGIEQLTGATLLPDLSRIELDGRPVLLSHGDILCSRDVSYQWYRRFMECRLIKSLFLAFPYALRSLLARGLRPVMQRSLKQKRPAIIDTDQATIERIMRRYAVTELIHGHTHRPGIHTFRLAGRDARRIVLGDWYETDSVLVCRGDERRLMRVEEYLNPV